MKVTLLATKENREELYKAEEKISKFLKDISDAEEESTSLNPMLHNSIFLPTPATDSNIANSSSRRDEGAVEEGNQTTPSFLSGVLTGNISASRPHSKQLSQDHK